MIEQSRIGIDTSKTPNFIGCWSHVDVDLCEAIIQFYESHPELHLEGKIGLGNLDELEKKSTDLKIEPVDLKLDNYQIFNRYFQLLHECFQDYCEQWSFLKEGFKDRFHCGPFNIQCYDIGDHFSGLHAERTGFTYIHRIFAWMTYLNDVKEGGETEFPHYGLKVTPVAGKTLIWPAEWTHAHRGCVTRTPKKYIVTGWLHLAPR
jgi:hypothetical protein